MALNIADLFEHAVDAVPERLAIACGDKTVTYAELEAMSNRVAHCLAAGGVGPGDHVGMYGRNSIELVASFLACYKLRAIPVNVNYRYVETELRYLFSEAEFKGLVHDRQYSDKVAAVLAGYPDLGVVLVIGDGSELPLPAGAADFHAAASGVPAGRDFGERSADDIYMLYTGGTTGYPKGVLWRHEDVWRTLGGGIDFTTGERLPDEWEQIRRGTAGPAGMVRLATAPLIHGSTQWGTLPALFCGDTVVFVPQFDPHDVWRAVQRHKVNVLMIIGDAMARPLIEAYQQEEYDLSSVLAISSNAALFSPSVKEQYLALLPERRHHRRGRRLRDRLHRARLRVRRETRRPRARRSRRARRRSLSTRTTARWDRAALGRIARGGHIPLGYYKDPVKTAALFADVDGARYAVPGDWARVEEDGSFTLLGRGNTCVNTGGEKVFPEEVEGALKSFEPVFDALVIGVPDERLGQRVAAIVQTRDGEGLGPGRPGSAPAHEDRRLQAAALGVAGRQDQPDTGRQGRLHLGPRIRRAAAGRGCARLGTC